MKHSLISFFVICIVTTAFARDKASPLSQTISSRKALHESFVPASLFSAESAAPQTTELYSKVVTDAVVLNLKKSQSQQLLSAPGRNITFSIPDGKGGEIELELFKAEIFTPDFSVAVSNGERPVLAPGAHYRGIIKGDVNSVAAISIFEDEVMGMISSPSLGNLVLGKLENDPASRHILYNDKDLRITNEMKCMTSDDDKGYTLDQLQSPQVTSVNCIRIYWELNYDIYLDKGSIANATNYAVGLFNESATLYANDGIPVELSQVFVWNTASPYTGTTPLALRNQFQAYRNSFNGDLSHLLGYAGGGGVAAGFNGLCAVNLDDSQCYSAIQSSYSTVPTYSWSVEVVTHEQGHLMGSRHTHACVWNGNNTAIDGCGPVAGYPYEGNCSGAPLPGNGGTVMSYCHLIPTGINFSNGFGTQPANVILNNYNNAPCLSPCVGGGLCLASSNTNTLNVTTTTADFVWEAAGGAVSYNIQYRIVGNVAWSADTSQDTVYHAIGLTPGSNYEWQVQTVCANGTSIFTSSTNFTTIPLTCDPPFTVTTTTITAFSADLSWSAVPGALSYLVEYKIFGALQWDTVVTTQTTYHLTGLTPNSLYEYHVQTICVGGGVSSFSVSCFFLTHEIGQIENIVLKPDAICGKDAVIAGNIPLNYYNTNFGTSTEFDLIGWTNGGSDSPARTLQQFDLTFIPEGSSIQSALLSLYWDPISSNNGHSQLTGPNDGYLEIVTDPWDEHTVTWVNQPGSDTTGRVYLPVSTSNTQDYLNIDVTNLVQGFVNSPGTNYGWMAKLVNENPYRSLTFCSSDHPDSTKWPSLSISYAPNNPECNHYQYSFCEGKDALIGNCIPCGYDTSNYGDAADFDIVAWTNGGNVSNARSLIQWELNEIPTNALIDTALFSLYWNPIAVNTGHSTMSGPNDFYINVLTGPWTEDAVTWNNQPGITVVNQIHMPPSTVNTQDYTDINVTAIVQDWVSNPGSNYGLILKLVNESYYRSLAFCSSDHPDPAKHPKLDVCWHIPTGIKEHVESSIKVYEELSSHTIHIVSDKPFAKGTDLQIFNSTGQLVLSEENISGNHFVTGREQLTSGIYFYRLLSGDTTYRGKVVLR